jgi:TolB-like protein/predicted Ser/Thr protein kinase
MSSVMLGKTLTHYSIRDKIGAGGMGVVYRARDERLQRDVALKVLPPAALGDEASRARFRREAMALSRLNHPNIATVHDFDSQDGVDFLVMEYVDGETLAQRISRGAIPESECADLAVQIAEALEEAHERGVIHRDLKPGNVIVTGKGRVKVLDFGLAKLFHAGDAGETASVSAAGTWSGTVPYMPPEQLEGQPTDERSDLYALGAILYEMATGRRVFAASSAPRLFSAILNDSPAPPSSLAPGLSPALDALVARLLDKSPARRPAAAREVIAALGSLADATRRGAVPAAGREGAGAKGIEGLVVLPLENLSGDPEQEYFADGMTEELIAGLAQIQALRVVSRTSAMRYKGHHKTLQEVGRELQVDAVVEGSVRRHGDRVRITAQLIEVASDRHLWAKSYEGDLKEVLSLQGEVAQQIAKEVQIKLTPHEEARFAQARAVDPRAYEAYLKGRHHWNKRTEEGLLKSLEYFREAIDRDPVWATAYAGLADAYNVIGFHAVLPPGDCFPKAKAAASAALKIDERLAEAHAAAAYAQHYHEWDWKAAEQNFRRAIELNDGNANSHLFYMNFLVAMGREAESEREVRRAHELDPLSLIINAAVGWAPFFARKFPEAVERLRRAAELDHNFPTAYIWLSWACDLGGFHEEAVEHGERAAVLTARGPMALAALASAHAGAGRTAQAEAELQELLELAKRRYVSPYDTALVCASLGRAEEGLALLERAHAGRSHLLVLMRVDPRLDPLRGDPRFAEIQRRMSFP